MSLRANDFLRYHDTDDGQDFWYVGLAGVLEIVAAEIEDQPLAWIANTTTGEIFQGSALPILLDHVVDGIRDGHSFRIEPVIKPADHTEGET